MVTQDPALMATIIVAAAVLPPVLYIVYIRNVEKYRREPWGAIFRAFLFGAILSVVIALLLTGVVAKQLGVLVREYDLLRYEDPTDDQAVQDLTFEQKILIIVIAAPLVEEFAKGLGLVGARRHMTEVEDGIIYGAAAGLGFSATENLLYELAALTSPDGGGFAGAIAVTLARSVTSTFLHATATGILGYGIARRRVHGGSFLEIIPFYAMAVLLHAVFNAIAILQFLGSFLLILLISLFAIRWTIRRIRVLDRGSAARFA